MTQPTIRELAKQGDPQAIAILFNRALKPKGITTTASRLEDILSLIVEADPTPDREAIATTIHKGLTKLEVRSIRKVKLFGRQSGKETPAWEREFILEIPEDETLEPLSERLQEPPKLDLSIEGEELESQEAQTPKDGMHGVGDVVRDRYRILEQIGRGSNGITYKAEDLQTKELVAIKALSLRNMGDWKQIELFEREAKILEQLNHPAIPRYLDYFQIDTSEDRAFYIVQQLAEGQNLAKLVENGWRTNEKGVRKIAIQVLEILTYLHDLKPPVIHRDIKPHNLIYGNDGKIFLVDFGAVQDTYRSTMARDSTVVGTFGYMAPEQFQGQSVPATDLYALGATLLFLLTHRSPSELPQERLRYSFRSKVQISDDFANWLQKIVEPDLEDRFHSAKEALGTLRGRLAIGSKLRKPLSRKALVGMGVATVVIGSIINAYKWDILIKFFRTDPPLLAFCNMIEGSGYKALPKLDEKTRQLMREYINNIGYFNYNVSSASLKHTSCISESGDREIIQLLSDKKIDFDKDIALFFVRSADTAKLLIEEGANVNARYSGYTSLHVKDINVINDAGSTPLHFVKSLDIAKLLIEKGADVNARNNSGSTPLHFVKSLDIAKLLIEKSADVNAKTNDGSSPLHVVQSIDIAKLLIEKGTDVNARNNSGSTPLHFVKSLDIAKLLIEKGADVNARSNDGTSPLHVIKSLDIVDIAKLLIEKGADVNAKTNNGWSSLHSVKSLDMAKLLIAKGADVNAKTNDKDAWTPLLLAVGDNYTPIALFLIEKGADVNAKTNDGWTPLLLAAQGRNNTELAKLLIAKGADINARNASGWSPLDIAKINKNKEFEKLLIEKGADVNAKESEDNTPLVNALLNNNTELVKLLVEKGADVNTQNKYGYTPLECAQNIEIAKLLIEKGADVNARNAYGVTQLAYASSNQKVEIVKLLIEKGADVNGKDNNGDTPLDYALAKNNTEVATLLIKNGARRGKQF